MRKNRTMKALHFEKGMKISMLKRRKVIQAHWKGKGLLHWRTVI